MLWEHTLIFFSMLYWDMMDDMTALVVIMIETKIIARCWLSYMKIAAFFLYGFAGTYFWCRLLTHYAWRKVSDDIYGRQLLRSFQSLLLSFSGFTMQIARHTCHVLHTASTAAGEVKNFSPLCTLSCHFSLPLPPISHSHRQLSWGKVTP